MTKNSDDYDEKYMKIKFNSDDELPLNKTMKSATTKIAVIANLKTLNIIPTFS